MARLKISCVYVIENKVNGHHYVGSTKDFAKRMGEHKRKLLKNQHHNPYLQRAYNKYGLDNFTFDIAEEVSREDRLALEQYYLKRFKPEYNIALTSTCPMEGRKHNDKTKAIMRNIHLGNTYNLGRKATPEARKNMGLARLGGKRNDTTKLKMSETAKRINAIDRIDRTLQMKKIIDKNGIIYCSLSEAARLTEYSVSAICDNLKGRSKATWDGNYFKYYQEQLNEQP